MLVPELLQSRHTTKPSIPRTLPQLCRDCCTMRYNALHFHWQHTFPLYVSDETRNIPLFERMPDVTLTVLHCLPIAQPPNSY